MTGRELIILILENHLEDMEFNPAGYMSVEEAAIKYNVGTETINVWINNGVMPAVKIGNKYYVPNKN